VSTSGHNWGEVSLHGRSLMFMSGGKVAFEVPLPDVAQVGVCVCVRDCCCICIVSCDSYSVRASAMDGWMDGWIAPRCLALQL
jgi:hypothetical protein